MKIVALGDSFTSGYGVAGGQAWPEVLAGLTGCDVVNKGIHGDTTTGMLARFQTDAAGERPRFLLMEGGFNDFLCGGPVGGAQANMMAMVHQAYHNQMIPVVLLQPYGNPEQFRQFWPEFIDIGRIQTQMREYQRWLETFCRGFSVFHVDVSRTAERYIDGIHLDQDGHRKVAERIQSFFNHI